MAKAITQYVADDGTIFDNEADALAHEGRVSITELIREHVETTIPSPKKQIEYLRVIADWEEWRAQREAVAPSLADL